MSRIRIPPRLPFPRETRIERSMIEKPLQDIHVSADVPARADARLRALTENALEIITVQDPSGVFTYVNEAVKRHLGYTAAELLGRNPSEFIHPDDLAAMRERFRSVRAAQGANLAENCFEYRFKHRDGTWCWLESIAVNALENPVVGGIIAHSRDINR